VNREAGAPRCGDAAGRIHNATGIAAVGTRGLRLLTLRMVALVEFIKGALVLVAGVGLLALMHRDLQDLAEALIHHLHLNPANEAPRIFLDLAGRLDSVNLWLLALGAGMYAAVRIAEGYGLWRDRAWAEWLGAVSGLIYVPFELHALSKGVTALRLTTLVINLVVVLVLCEALWRRGRQAGDLR
jgi:uncharacterized membrane protein (DUF2068 family)